MESLELNLDGLTWVHKLFGLEPRWTVEPDTAAMEQTVQSLNPSSTVKVTFLAQGAFNKLYDVDIDGEVFILRVSLPVDPGFKIMSEVATMDWVRRITSLPIPKVITYKSSRDSPIGFEWILMTKMPGNPLGEVWHSLSFDTKSRLVREIARSSACLFRHQLRGIGNIYGKPSTSTKEISPLRDPVVTKEPVLEKPRGSDDTSNPPDSASSEEALPDVGRIVSMQFFWGSHIRQDVFRGPFRSSKDWMTARLLFNRNDCQSILRRHSAGDPDLDEDDEDDATRTLGIIDKLDPLIPLFFPANDEDPERSIMVHDDLSGHNILVNEDGELTGVLDWECVSALPLWRACDYPAFLERNTEHVKPDISRYDPEGGKELYLEDLRNYETTLLRVIFIDEMKQLSAGWMEVFEKSQSKREFDMAAHGCDNEFIARHVKAWLADATAAAETGDLGNLHNLRSLQDRIDNFF